MEKLLEALKSLLPEDQIKEVSEILEGYLSDAKTELEAEYDNKLKEAYTEMTEEKGADETVAEQGYQQAKYQLAILNQKNKPTFNKDKIIEFPKTNR